ncbi:hypothetical protein G9C98_003100 [Cotesia typhae]|uniref:Tetratricopeptide repeat protein 7 N-terminal domain-containing protein n=1 Tax=Cotesia typhae TaxID=2053667 RepID=A0A8J5V7W0_9HYME|nr:hypothetical protein G9C98_003100 [Cotesia typhae]
MTSKKGQTLRIENEIDKYRGEGNWKKVIELANSLKELYPSNECLANFLSGEGKLENFLEETPPIEANITKAKTGLIDAKKDLVLAANEKDKQAVVVLDAHLLLGKLHYAMGLYSEALHHYDFAELHTLTEKPLPPRSLRIIAESYAIQGLCFEKQLPTIKSKYKLSEYQERMIKCFETSGDLSLVYFQELEKSQVTQNGGYSPQPPITSKTMGPILETALLRAPLMHLQSGNIERSINRWREILSAIETTTTQSLRLTLIRQLAELLLRRITNSDYKAPEVAETTTMVASNTLTRKLNNYATINGMVETQKSPWKPKKYQGINMFVPRTINEEIILLLLIGEAMAVRDAVLSQSPEFKEAKSRAHEVATNVYDLLTIVTVKWNQVELLYESFKRAMKFSHEEIHVWTQYALCLIQLGQYAHAYSVLEIVARLAPNKVMPCLLAARMCYEHLEKISTGIEWAKKAVSRENNNPSGLISRCHLYVGIGNSILARSYMVKADKATHSTQALEAFHKAQQYDPNDHLAEYYLAYEYAINRQLNEAMIHVKIALNLRAEHIPSLHLLALLLSAYKQYNDALNLVNSILVEYPDNSNFLYIKAHLQLHSVGAEESIITIKEMLKIWRDLYENQVNVDCNEQQSEKRSETRSIFQLYSTELSDKDSSSVHAQSLAASKIEQALSEVASSLSSFTPKPGPQRAWLLQLQIWLLLTEVFLMLDKPDAAALSLQEATNIFPMSHHIMYTGLIYHYLGCQRLAEKTLRDAAKIDPNSHQTWYNLGKVLESLGEMETANDCMATALEVENSNPILPVSSIGITFE